MNSDPQRKLIEQWRVRADAIERGESEDIPYHDTDLGVLMTEIETLRRCAKNLEDVLNAPAEKEQIEALGGTTQMPSPKVVDLNEKLLLDLSETLIQTYGHHRTEVGLALLTAGIVVCGRNSMTQDEILAYIKGNMNGLVRGHEY